MDYGVHLPLIGFGGEPPSLRQLTRYAETAERLGFAALSANDHLLFPRPWLDGPTVLSSVLAATGRMDLMTTVALPVVRGPMALAKSMAAIDILSGGRLIVGVGPGSSARDYAAAGKDPDHFPNAIATMFFHITEDCAEADQILQNVLAPMLNRPCDELRKRLLVGSFDECAEKLAAYQSAGAHRILLWPIQDELQQLAKFQEQVVPQANANSA